MTKHIYKTLALVTVAILTFKQASAADSDLLLHLSCTKVSDTCVEIEFGTGPNNKLLINKNPEIYFSKENIVEAELGKGEYGQDEIQITLNDQASEKFKTITKTNISKQLVIILNGKVLMAPTIQGEIATKSLRITTSVDTGLDFLEDLPWLKKMSEDKKASDKRLSLISIISYLLVGVLVVGGSVYFAFLRKPID